MEILIAISVGVLVGCGVYLMLTRELIRVILGSLLLSYGVNLALFVAGGVNLGGPPILTEVAGGEPVTDPVPQALILTAIVIGLAMFALLLALGYRTFEENATDDLEQLTGEVDEPGTLFEASPGVKHE